MMLERESSNYSTCTSFGSSESYEIHGDSRSRKMWVAKL